MRSKKPTYQELEQELAKMRNAVSDMSGEEKFESYFDNNKAIMLQIEVKTKKIKRANKAACNFYGYTNEEFCSKSVYDLQTLTPEEVNLRMQQAAQNQSDFFEFTHKLANQEHRVVQVYASTFSFNGEMHMVTTIYDITDKKIAAKELQKARDQWEKIFEAIGHPAVILNANKEIVKLNKNLSKRTDNLANEILKLKCFDVFQNSSECASQNCPYNHAIETNKTAVSEMEVPLLKGYYKVSCTPIYDDNQTLQNVIYIATDITESKRYEQSLKLAKEAAEENEERFRNLFEYAPVGKSITSIDGTIHVNSSYCKMLGYTQEELESAKWANLTHPDDIQESIDIIKSILEGKQKQARFEKRFIHKNGSIVWSDVSTYLHRDKSGKPLYFITTLSDISESKKAKLELLKAKEKAEESDRLKTAFLQNLSHEIRTPMNAIIGFADLLANDNISGQKRTVFSHILKESSYKLLSIVTDVLTISSLETKQEILNIAAFNLNDLVVSLLGNYIKNAREHDIDLFTHQPLSDKQSEIFGDKSKINQILSNLLSNALKFTIKGSVEFGYNLHEDQLVFFVKDTGIGIPAQQHTSIFDRFSQADQSIQVKYGGTGLGLSISKGFVELMGGRIWVESELNNGACFYFTIKYEPVNSSEIAPVAHLPKISSTVIVVAEDEEYIFLYIEELLKEYNCMLVHTKNGLETLEYCQKNSDVALILMDVKMPVMNGHEAALQIKKIHPNLPIIAQTAYAMSYELEKFSKNAFNDYISKPINSKELIQKIQNFIPILHLNF